MHVNFKFDARLCFVIGLCALVGIYAVFSAFPVPAKFYPSSSSDLAAWFQFFGGAAAVVVAIYFSRHEQRAKTREDEHVAYVTAIHLLSNITVNSIKLQRLNSLLNSSGSSTKFKSSAGEWCDEINKLTPPTESQFLNIARAPSSGGVLLAEAWGEIDYLKRCMDLWLNSDLPKMFAHRDYTDIQKAHVEYSTQFAAICNDILVAHKQAEEAIKSYCYKHPIGKFSKVNKIKEIVY